MIYKMKASPFRVVPFILRKVYKTLYKRLEKTDLREYINKWLAGFLLIAAAFLCARTGTDLYRGFTEILIVKYS